MYQVCSCLRAFALATFGLKHSTFSLKRWLPPFSPLGLCRDVTFSVESSRGILFNTAVPAPPSVSSSPSRCCFLPRTQHHLIYTLHTVYYLVMFAFSLHQNVSSKKAGILSFIHCNSCNAWNCMWHTVFKYHINKRKKG